MLLTVKEAAKRLKCGASTVYEKVHTDPTFPAVWLNSHCVRVVEAKLPEWLEQQIQRQQAQKAVAHG